MWAAMSLADTLILAISFYLISAKSCQVSGGVQMQLKSDQRNEKPLHVQGMQEIGL